MKLKFCKTPALTQRLLTSVSKSLLSNMPEFRMIPNDDISEIEQWLLLSAVSINFVPEKDMNNSFIRTLLNNKYDNLSQKFSYEEIILMFESSGSGICFMSDSAYERKTDAEDELKMYLLDRLMLYRDCVVNCYEHDSKQISTLSIAIFDSTFYPGRYFTHSERLYIDGTCFENTGKKIPIPNSRMKQILMILKPYFNAIPLPVDKKRVYPFYHTEGKLAYLKIGSDYLSFNSISGSGNICCRDCGTTHEVLSFVHGATSALIGRQCPECGTLCAEYNESKEYHSFGPSIDDFICPKCGTVIRHKEESIFKGNANPIFCPKCESTNVKYTMKFLT